MSDARQITVDPSLHIQEQTGTENQVRAYIKGPGRVEMIMVSAICLGLVTLSGVVAVQATKMWALIVCSITIFILFLGRWVSGTALGILIGNRNLMSLSRFQMVLWTVLIFSAYLTMALCRVRSGAKDPLTIGMDWHLWALMGISTTSLVGVPLLLGAKTQKEVHPDAINKAERQLKETIAPENYIGSLYANKTMNEASLCDIFQGDEVGNTSCIDVAKMQMFLFTLVGLVSYGAAVHHVLTGVDYSLMPTVPDGLVALMGISHAGYLASKTADHTQVK
jgi:hypothetical protein